MFNSVYRPKFKNYILGIQSKKKAILLPSKSSFGYASRYMVCVRHAAGDLCTRTDNMGLHPANHNVLKIFRHRRTDTEICTKYVWAFRDRLTLRDKFVPHKKVSLSSDTRQKQRWTSTVLRDEQSPKTSL